MFKSTICVIIIIIFAFCLFIFSHSKIYENEQIKEYLYSIDKYDQGCKDFDYPTNTYKIIVERYRYNAIPTLLKSIITDDVNSKVGFNGYLYVSICLIQRITSNTDAEWIELNDILREEEPLISVEKKYLVAYSIMNELRIKNILSCQLNNKKFICEKI